MTSLWHLVTPYRRSRRWRRSVYRLVTLVFGFVVFLDVLRVSFPEHDSRPETLDLSTGFKRPSIFIATIHWNNEMIIRSHWAKALLEFVNDYGAENVYVSIFESGSYDNTKGALQELDVQLRNAGVERNVELDDTSHKALIEQGPKDGETGWINTPRGKKELRRIPYLAALRNKVMSQMRDLSQRTSDILTLLATHNSSYAAACSLDFEKPPSYYDTFALRDSSGAKPIMDTWPYFLSWDSRHALIGNQPVPVQSCWNGIVAFDSAPFYGDVMPGKPTQLAFRGIEDSLASSHLEGSECCLIHADNYLSARKGVWLNPAVRVGYDGSAYDAVHPTSSHGSISWPSPRDRFIGIWRNRFVRMVGRPKRMLESLVVYWRMRGWERETGVKGEKRKEVGVQCVVNEMQVLVERGWLHV
ncbi:glycosyltransferase family 69 protein [Lepidopterella palustris CBS 459.81]|uniref:Glycosyltransferase family 69 protein n=1 Tax=Lepidopterella palustris CBS 459.81 TaxID=1314670 RepID=A0A8E2JFP7_9PEZI|nr:glycosyltransferase family 69 protein [Lepidopterella palustris CBS 459.81]